MFMVKKVSYNGFEVRDNGKKIKSFHGLGAKYQAMNYAVACEKKKSGYDSCMFENLDGNRDIFTGHNKGVWRLL